MKQEIIDDGTTESGTAHKMIMYEGALVDVASLKSRLERSDKTRTAMEDRYKQLKLAMGTLCYEFMYFNICKSLLMYYRRNKFFEKLRGFRLFICY